jgi:hypothetical protein
MIEGLYKFLVRTHKLRVLCIELVDELLHPAYLLLVAI